MTLQLLVWWVASCCVSIALQLHVMVCVSVCFASVLDSVCICLLCICTWCVWMCVYVWLCAVLVKTVRRFCIASTAVHFTPSHDKVCTWWVFACRFKHVCTWCVFACRFKHVYAAVDKRVSVAYRERLIKCYGLEYENFNVCHCLCTASALISTVCCSSLHSCKCAALHILRLCTAPVCCSMLSVTQTMLLS